MRYEERKLGDYIEILSGFAFKTKDFATKGVPIIKIKNICPPYVSLDDLTYVSEEIAESQKKFILNYDDVLIAMTGSHINQWASVVGRVARVKYNSKTLLNQRVGRITIKDGVEVDIDYIYYFLSQDKVKIELAAKAGGAANQANISPTHIKELLFPCPDINVQTKIGSILKSYDDLIENNHKQIKLLEEAAQRLYKEWFVDLRFPGYESVEIVDGIPEGWENCELNDFCYVTDGTHDSPKTKDYGIPLVTGKCIKNGYIDYSDANLISVEDHSKIIKRSGLKTGDILFSNIGTIGSTCRVDYDREFSVKNVIILKPDTVAQTNFLYCWINSRYIQDTFLNQTNGSSQQFIGLSFMRKFGIIVPTNELIDKFNNLVSVLLTRKDLLHRQTEQLGEMRDRLLPKLMSGEIEV